MTGLEKLSSALESGNIPNKLADIGTRIADIASGKASVIHNMAIKINRLSPFLISGSAIGRNCNSAIKSKISSVKITPAALKRRTKRIVGFTRVLADVSTLIEIQVRLNSMNI